MKYLTITILIYCLFVGAVYSWDDDTYEIQSKFIDIDSNDGVMDAGTHTNPYVVRGSSGREVGVVQPKYFDVVPNDGVMDAGSQSNPYEIKFKGR